MDLLVIGSLVVALLGLGWKIYTDRRKPRLRVRVHVVQVTGRVLLTRSLKASDNQLSGDVYVAIEVTNRGPGRIKIAMVEGRAGRWWQRLPRGKQNKFIIEKFTFGKLPYWLGEGDKIDLLVPFNEDCVLSVMHLSHLGVRDGYDRYHWAPTKQLRIAAQQYNCDFC